MQPKKLQQCVQDNITIPHCYIPLQGYRREGSKWFRTPVKFILLSLQQGPNTPFSAAGQNELVIEYGHNHTTIYKACIHLSGKDLQR